MSEADDLKLLVELLKEPLMLLVREGYIDERQAEERARSQAMGLGAYFELHRHPEEEPYDVAAHNRSGARGRAEYEYQIAEDAKK